jgi:hypothetical protein
MIDDKFLKAVVAMEKRTNCAAYAVINPADPEKWGRIVISYPRDGAGRMYAIAWLPNGTETAHHCGHASGFGYDKKTAAMGGAEFLNLKTGQTDRLQDQGYSFEQQLRAAGYIVIQTV